MLGLASKAVGTSSPCGFCIISGCEDKVLALAGHGMCTKKAIRQVNRPSMCKHVQTCARTQGGKGRGGGGVIHTIPLKCVFRFLTVHRLDTCKKHHFSPWFSHISSPECLWGTWSLRKRCVKYVEWNQKGETAQSSSTQLRIRIVHPRKSLNSWIESSNPNQPSFHAKGNGNWLRNWEAGPGQRQSLWIFSSQEK